MKIDAHQHFWKYDPVKHSWINDSMAILKQDYLPDDLWPVLKKNAIAGCVAVQADQSEEETDFLIACAREHQFIKGVVGWIDLKAPDVEERLEKYTQQPLLKGFRHVIQDEADPEFILDKQFQKGLRLLKRYNYTYDILIFPHQMEAALTTVEQNPDQKFVIDHLAKPYIKKQLLDEWAKYMKAFGKHENVFCKVSGMITEADWQAWRYDDFLPYLDCVFGSFGPERIIFGSDWPVCLLAGKYDEVKEIVSQYIRSLTGVEQERVMGLTALDFYNIKQ